MSEADILSCYGNSRMPYPTLYTLTASSETTRSSTKVQIQVGESLSAFASDRSKLIEQYFKKLDGFSGSNKNPSQKYQLEQRSDQFSVADDIPLEVHQKLYKTLERYSDCTCSPSKARHCGRLRLKDRFRTLENDVLFDTVFAEVPSLPFSESMEWQQLQLHISK